MLTEICHEKICAGKVEFIVEKKGYFPPIKRSGRLFKYILSSNDFPNFESIYGTDKRIELVSLADFLYDSEQFTLAYNKSKNNEIATNQNIGIVSLIEQLIRDISKILPSEIMIKRMVYTFLNGILLPFVCDNNANGIWFIKRFNSLNDSEWTDYFLTNDGKRQYLPPIFKKLRLGELIFLPQSSLYEEFFQLWKDIIEEKPWWEIDQERELPDGFNKTYSFLGKITGFGIMSVEDPGVGIQGFINVEFDEDIRIKIKKTTYDFGKEIKRIPINIYRRDEKKRDEIQDMLDVLCNKTSVVNVYIDIDHNKRMKNARLARVRFCIPEIVWENKQMMGEGDIKVEKTVG